jgi:hypothetical protein
VGLSGLSRREIQRRLGKQGSAIDVGRVLRGDMDLRLRHLLAIIGAIDVQPLDFFELVFPARLQPRSPLAQLFEKALVPTPSPAGPPGPPRGSQAPAVSSARTTDSEARRRRMVELMREMESLIAEGQEAATSS